MPAPSDVPPQLLVGPFTRGQAIAAGLSLKVLRGRRFRQLFRGVWVFVGHVMTDADWIVAATLAMPTHAYVSHLTRIQALGLRDGPLRPFHFTVAGDLHLAVPDIFLHRAEVLPPTDEVGVTPAMAFIGVCATARVVDLIKIGDWLLHHGHMTLLGLRELAVRAGAPEPPSLCGSRIIWTRTRVHPRSPRRARCWSSPACRSRS